RLTFGLLLSLLLRLGGPVTSTPDPLRRAHAPSGLGQHWRPHCLRLAPRMRMAPDRRAVPSKHRDTVACSFSLPPCGGGGGGGAAGVRTPSPPTLPRKGGGRKKGTLPARGEGANRELGTP